nr:uncharacterized protein LOC127490707 [Oryctolagus cuniculus]
MGDQEKHLAPGSCHRISAVRRLQRTGHGGHWRVNQRQRKTFLSVSLSHCPLCLSKKKKKKVFLSHRFCDCKSGSSFPLLSLGWLIHARLPSSYPVVLSHPLLLTVEGEKVIEMVLALVTCGLVLVIGWLENQHCAMHTGALYRHLTSTAWAHDLWSQGTSVPFRSCGSSQAATSGHQPLAASPQSPLPMPAGGGQQSPPRPGHKARYREKKEGQRERRLPSTIVAVDLFLLIPPHSIHWFTLQMAASARLGQAEARSQKPGDSSGSPTWVQGPKHWDHLPLLSKAINRELDRKWSSRNSNQWPI